MAGYAVVSESEMKEGEVLPQRWSAQRVEIMLMLLVQQLVGKLCQNIDLWSCVSHHYILALVPPSVFIHFSSSGKYLGAAGNSKAGRTFYLTQGKPPWWLHQCDGSLWPLGHLPYGGLCSRQLPIPFIPILLLEISGF